MKHDIKLYHFTPDHLLMGCQLDGLTKGVLPIQISGQIRVLANIQWLTLNPSFTQSWNVMSSLPYDRTANRLTICIPHTCIESLYLWTAIGPLMAPKTYQWLSLVGDAQNWCIYVGKIPPEWIVETIKNPNPQRRQHVSQRQT